MPTKPKTFLDRLREANPRALGRQPTDRAYRFKRARDPVQAEADRLRASRQWRAVRRVKLDRDPLCELCLAEGRTVVACDVNHRTPVRVLVEQGRPRDAFRLAELQSLCRSHHNAITAAETRERRSG